MFFFVCVIVCNMKNTQGWSLVCATAKAFEVKQARQNRSQRPSKTNQTVTLQMVRNGKKNSKGHPNKQDIQVDLVVLGESGVRSGLLVGCPRQKQ